MKRISRIICFSLALATFGIAGEVPENFKTENLVAWCIVPFDASKRGPEERASMVKELGFQRVAYDWRKEHIPTFGAELDAYAKNGIEMFSFWKGDDSAYALFRERGVKPQIWRTLRSSEAPTQEERVKEAVATMEPVARQTKEDGLAFGLYNHGGWGGEPANLVAVCEALRELGYDNVGIVYNFHHGHDRIDEWAEDLALMKPYLLCLNLNGMIKGGPEMGKKILEIGKGEEEAKMILEIVRSGYSGPIGILDHQMETDSAKTLRENLDGLAKILASQ
ncbi:MAG: hypothetical protein AAGF67_06515 [Verrucomicrobiota bacterium]